VLLGDSQEPSGVLVHLHLSHDAPGYSGKLPPKRPWQSSARNKVRGGRFVWPEQRAGRCWQSSATIRHRPPRSPSSADLELPRGPRAGSTAARPRAVRATSSYPQQTPRPRGQTGAPPRRPRADPPPPSLEFAAKSNGAAAPTPARPRASLTAGGAAVPGGRAGGAPCPPGRARRPGQAECGPVVA